jgi:hypothetical protein
MGFETTRSGIGALATAALATASSAPAESPSALWRGVARVGIVCLVNTDHGVDTGPLHDRLCARARVMTAAGAPVPVAAVNIGDPAIFAANHLTLLVHASTGGTPGGKMMAISIRPYRNVENPGLLFGAEPRVVATGASDAALDAALAVPLTQLLPWRTAGARRIR